MEQDIQHDFDNEEQFWQKLDETISSKCDTHSLIDDALRSYLALATGFPDFVQSDHDLRLCTYKLYSSPLFEGHGDYIRRQFVHCLLQEDEASILHIAATFLLADARQYEHTFELLNDEGAFPRLVDLISVYRPDEEEGLHRQLMELMYEMARIQRISDIDLTHVTDEFICRLFGIIEQVSDDVNDPYHYPVIRVLLVLNEQFMVAAHDPTAVGHNNTPLTNKVVKVLSSHGSRYKTFGENIILLLNREDETSLQLLTLKLLYLLFTTPPTYEYFYTNDLHVLCDILVRNLLDLPEESASLRHTYLRVLYPLLEHTQLKEPPHYKRHEVRKLFTVLLGGLDESNGASGLGISHFAAVDETTKRLVQRCRTVSWLQESEPEVQIVSPVEDSPTKAIPPALPAPRKLRKRNVSNDTGPYLQPQLGSARQSSLSMAEMAAQKEKPGVKTPSRNPSLKHSYGIGLVMAQKKGKPEKPPPPKARRSGWTRSKDSKQSQSTDETNTEADLVVGPEGEKTESVAQEHAGQSRQTEEEDTKSTKKPPPAPKTRRWHLRRPKEVSSEEEKRTRDQNREPGKFETNLPSLSMPTREISIEETSPFSPPEEKTLSPLDIHTILKDKKSKRISSVSAALSQAQAQALQDLEQTFEKAYIIEETDKEHEYGEREADNDNDRIIHETAKGLESHENSSNDQRVLTPSGRASAKDVSEMQIKLERSPFLSDAEQEEAIDQKTPADDKKGDGEKGGGGGDDKNELSSEDEWN